jgi:hypothetical protein
MAVQEDGGAWRYRSANEAVESLAGRLEAAYRERPVWVINAIASRPDALKSLSDAFDMRKDRT